MKRQFVRDEAGIVEILKSEKVAKLITATAERVANGVRASTDRPVEVRSGFTDRARSTVTITDVAGAASESKHARLLTAALAEGLDVKPR